MNKIWRVVLGVPCFLLIVIFCGTQYLNHTGFCYTDMKYPNEREIVDRYLFKGKEIAMTLDDKVTYVKENFDGADYLGCCKYDGVSDDSRFGEPYEKILISLFTNHPTVYGHKIRVLFPQGARYSENPKDKHKAIDETKPPFESVSIYTDSCGSGYWNLGKSYLDEEAYKIRTWYIRKYWEFHSGKLNKNEYERLVSERKLEQMENIKNGNTND